LRLYTGVMNNSLHIALLMGSSREGRVCDTVTRWVAGQIESQGDLTLDVIDPAKLDLPRHLPSKADEATVALRERIGRADAVVVVTPEYNHGYPAALKQVIDSVHGEWQAKPVAFVSYGGVSRGLRAVEQLRLVFAELHTVTVRETVSFAGASEQFDASGALRDPDAALGAMKKLLAQLRWWASALLFARNDVPYGETKPHMHAAVPEGYEGPVVLINTFTPKPGKLDAFLAAQIAEQGRLAGHVRGIRGARIHRSIDGKNAVGMAVFESARAHREWIETARFADHFAVIAPLLERADPKLYTVAFEGGTL
jgi:NAD(P)H-dependent FMN reductase